MNVAFGGTLIEDIPDSVGEAVQHRLLGKEECFHSVRVSPHSQLAKILGQTEMEVPSFHHQAVKKTAARLREVAHSPDGVIEAVEIPDHPFAIGVQWHPELSVDPLQQKLFDALVQCASAKR
jgi:putative glutamine amidotransferase